MIICLFTSGHHSEKPAYIASGQSKEEAIKNVIDWYREMKESPMFDDEQIQLLDQECAELESELTEEDCASIAHEGTYHLIEMPTH